MLFERARLGKGPKNSSVNYHWGFPKLAGVICGIAFVCISKGQILPKPRPGIKLPLSGPPQSAPQSPAAFGTGRPQNTSTIASRVQYKEPCASCTECLLDPHLVG